MPVLFRIIREVLPIVGFEIVRRSIFGLGTEEVGVSFVMDVSEFIGAALSDRHRDEFW